MELYHTTPAWSSRASLPVSHALGVELNRPTVRLSRCVCFCSSFVIFLLVNRLFCFFSPLLYPRLYLPVCIQLNRTYEDRCCCCTFEHLQVLLIYDVQHSPLWLSRASSPVSLWAFLTFFFNSHEHLRVLLFVAFVVQYAKALNNL